MCFLLSHTHTPTHALLSPSQTHTSYLSQSLSHTVSPMHTPSLKHSLSRLLYCTHTQNLSRTISHTVSHTQLLSLIHSVTRTCSLFTYSLTQTPSPVTLARARAPLGPALRGPAPARAPPRRLRAGRARDSRGRAGLVLVPPQPAGRALEAPVSGKRGRSYGGPRALGRCLRLGGGPGRQKLAAECARPGSC